MLGSYNAELANLVSIESTNIDKTFVTFQDEHIITTNNTTISTAVNKSFISYQLGQNYADQHGIQCHMRKVLMAMGSCDSFTFVQIICCITHLYVYIASSSLGLGLKLALLLALRLMFLSGACLAAYALT